MRVYHFNSVFTLISLYSFIETNEEEILQQVGRYLLTIHFIISKKQTEAERKYLF